MAEREDNVYKAKLAEQAERYDGKLQYMFLVNSSIVQYFIKCASSAFKCDVMKSYKEEIVYKKPNKYMP